MVVRRIFSRPRLRRLGYILFVGVVVVVVIIVVVVVVILFVVVDILDIPQRSRRFP